MDRTPKVFESKYRFCLILWEVEPINSTRLVGLCKERLGWSRSTTFTVIKRLCDRGVIKNENSVVTSLLSKDEVQRSALNELFETRFEGSIPAFVNAFAQIGNLNEKDLEEIRQMIERGMTTDD